MTHQAPALTLHYAPRTRSATALWMLEELGEPYALNVLDLSAGAHRTPEHLAINPMGKVPVVVHDGLPVAELGAIAIYLGDRFPSAGLAPGIDAPQRPAYLRWAFFASAIIEPTIGEKLFGWDLPDTSVAWGSFDRMKAAAEQGVAAGPWLLGETFSMADILVASGLRFAMRFGAMEAEGPLGEYVARADARPGYVRAQGVEQEHAGEGSPA